ncbi:MAG TPA: hypothetical protein PK867_24515 [Pirellulales bacterium]|nr:hypothetical protein [Pirellulales bacterium]
MAETEFAPQDAPRPSDAPVVALPGHRLAAALLSILDRCLASLCPSHRSF